MDKINYRIILDAHKGGTQKVLRGFFTGDVSARTIAVSINASGVSCKFGVGTTAIMYVTKENGVTNYGECEVVDNTVYYNVLQADTDCSGIVEMQLKVMNETTVLYAPTFALEVQESKTSDVAAETTPQFSALEAMVAKAQMAYDTRLLSIELRDDLTFVANFADGSVYESDALVCLKEAGEKMDEALREYESMKEQFNSSIQSALDSQRQAEQSAEASLKSATDAEASAENAGESAARAEESAKKAQAVAQLEIDTVLDTNSYNPIANKAVAEGLARYEGAEVLYTDILAKAVTLPKGQHYFRLAGGSYPTGTGLPSENYRYSTGAEVAVRGNGDCTVTLTGLTSLPPIYNHYDKASNKWFGWQTIATTADLAKYLPLTGGMIKNSSSAPFGITNTNGNEAYIPFVGSDGKLGYLGLFGKDNPIYKDSANAMIYPLLHTGNMADHVLPKSGGTVEANNTVPLGVKVTSNNIGAWFKFANNNGSLGHYGFKADGTPNIIMKDDLTEYDILHTGNMASHVLPLSGGEIASASQDPLAIKCKQSAYGAYAKYLNADGMLGYLGFNSAGKPIVMPNSWGNSKELHHDGNSSKVVINQTAPSDTNALWVY